MLWKEFWRFAYHQSLPLAFPYDPPERIFSFGTMKILLARSILRLADFILWGPNFSKSSWILWLKLKARMTTLSIADIFKIEDRYFRAVDYDYWTPKFAKVDLSAIPQVKDSNTFIGIEVEMENMREIISGLHE